MAKTQTQTYTFTEKAVKRLVIGDRVQSKSGKVLTVSLVVQKENRTIVLFDGDMEIDFDPYFQIKVINEIN